jgi:hypothetical protein
MHKTEVNCELGGQRPWHDLSKRDSFFVLGLGNPFPLFHEISMHIADEGHRTAKSPSTKA